MEAAARFKPIYRRLTRAAIHPLATCCYLLLMLLPLFLAGRYNHPAGDDYSNSVWTDFWLYQREMYFSWTGRFFSSAVLALNPIHWRSFTMYRIAADLLLVAFALSYTFSVCSLLKTFSRLSFQRRFALGAAATFIVLNGMNSLVEGFFWYTGAMTYTLPVVLLCWTWLIGMWLHKTSPRNLALPWLGQSILIIAATGCNEVSLLLPGLGCATMFWYYRRSGNMRLSRYYVLLTLVWLLTAMAAIGAPGNFERQAVTHRDLFIAVPSWLYFTKELFLEWILEPIFLAFSIAFLIVFTRAESHFRLPAFRLFIISLGLIALILLPGFLALGRMPPYRVRNLCFMVFLPAWLMTLAAIGQQLRAVIIRHPDAWMKLRSPLAIAVCIILLAQFRIETLRGSSNYFLLAKAFRKGTLVNYNAEQHARYALIRESRSDTVWVPPLRYQRGNTVFFSDLGPDPARFPNTGFAKFWQKSRIGLLPDSTVTAAP